MSLPRLALATEDVRLIAQVLRGALRLRTVVTPLATPPKGSGQHLLDIGVPGVGIVTLLAEVTGARRSDGYPLSVRPVTRVQMAELFSLLERLDEPSMSEPPPASAVDDSFGQFDPDEPRSDDSDPNTMIDDGPERAVMLRSPVLPMGLQSPLGARDSELPPSRRVVNSPVTVPPAATGSNVRPITSPAPPAPAPTSVRAGDPRVGKVIGGKYRIDAPIGSGAAATVYRATHNELRRQVAIKILHAQNAGETQFIRRFKSEALTASKLEHANVTRVIDFGQEPDGQLYLVMELIVGRSLETILSTEGPLPPKRVVDIGVQVCRALVFAHEKGVIHRDIKPENIMIVPDHDDDGLPCDLVKVCDFGLAKLRDPAADSDSGLGEESLITTSGMLCGSPAYMSPEQTRGEQLDFRTDIYSLGVSLFESLTGTLPHEAFSIHELFLKKCTEPPRRLSSVLPNIDAILDDIVDRAMALDPRARHASARVLRTELRAAREQMADDEENDHRTIFGG